MAMFAETMRNRFVLAALAGSAFLGCGGTTTNGNGGDDSGSSCTFGPAAIVRQEGIDKIDILFMIDNSASMGDKQDYLKQAVPDLIRRLVQPNCVDGNGGVVGQSDAQGSCVQGHAEFAPVHDMHIGIVTSALGPRLGDACNPTEPTQTGLLKHNDDQGHLVNRAGDDEHTLADAQPSSFLAWFPDVAANAGRTPGSGAAALKDVAALQKDFTDLVAGVHQLGCGIESQMESWYRFLIQPDPYDRLDSQSGRASWVDVDATIIAQRHDFLRPDSAVAIISLTDENDGEIDVRALGQQAWNWMSTGFQPPHGTSACNTNPNDPACTSCLLAPNHGAGDPNCSAPFSAQNDWGYNLNLRHVHMKQKYGVDVQFPMQRYVNGLTSTTVPNRDGEYPAGIANYLGTNNCTNPLFARGLPDGSRLDADTLCKLPRGQRTPDLVFYAHIGGVPSQLLHYTPGNPSASALSDGDWTKILGRDPQHYDYTGIDPHMVESFAPRPGLPPPSSADNADPIHGREWITNASSNFVDRQFACTFPLATPRDCSLPSNADICDCPASAGAPHDQIPPLCDPNNPTKQIRAKSYPTIRETLLARLLNHQGIVSSICPIHATEESPGDPLFGFRPAMSSLVDRLGSALSNQCLPRPLQRDDAGRAKCSILEVPPAGDDCNAARGSTPASPAIAKAMRDQLRESIGDAAATATVCEVHQMSGAELVNGSCTAASGAGWCYVSGAAAGTCPQAVFFSPSSVPVPGTLVLLQCAGSGPACGGT